MNYVDKSYIIKKKTIISAVNCLDRCHGHFSFTNTIKFLIIKSPIPMITNYLQVTGFVFLSCTNDFALSALAWSGCQHQ